MAKYYGTIGYAETVEVERGIYVEQIVEIEYVGDVIRNNLRIRGAAKINDDINVSNQISILADPYASNNFHAMRYATYMGAKWKITEVEVQYPRLIITLGGVYNGQ